MSDSPLDLPALEALCEAATPGPWYAMDDPAPSRADHGYRVLARTTRTDGRNVYGLREAMAIPGKGVVWNSDADAEFIAAARTALPALIAEVRGLRAQAERYRRTLRWIAPKPFDVCFETLSDSALDRAECNWCGGFFSAGEVHTVFGPDCEARAALAPPDAR